jgi:hypothetical protein
MRLVENGRLLENSVPFRQGASREGRAVGGGWVGGYLKIILHNPLVFLQYSNFSAGFANFMNFVVLVVVEVYREISGSFVKFPCGTFNVHLVTLSARISKIIRRVD